MMVGGAASDLFDGLFDIQIGDTDLSFKALTFQGLSAFLMMFGLIGLMISEMAAPQALSILGGLGAGGFSMWMVSKLFDTFKQSLSLDAFTPPLIPEWIEFTNVLYPELQAAILGDKTPQEALETASKKATEIMEDAGYF